MAAARDGGCTAARARRFFCFALILGVTVLSVALSPPFPYNDSAFFEYYGWSMLHGAHLYRDLLDVKLPSIFYVDELWQWLLGQNYFLHTCAEAAVNLLSIALVALLLRGFALPWIEGAAAFSLFYCLPFGQFNYAQHYAVPLILLAAVFGQRRHMVACGAAIALATTFWIPALLMIVPVLALERSWRPVRPLLLGIAAASGAYYLVLIPALGPMWPALPIALWPNNVSDRGVQLSQLWQTISDSALGPAIGVLLALLVSVVRKPANDAQCFALTWALCALAGTAIPPRFSEHFFLPSVPALVTAIASYGLDLATMRARFSALIVAAACLTVAIWQAYQGTINVRSYSAYVAHLGEALRSYAGAGAVLWTNEYIPELYLAMEAAQPDPYGSIHGLASGVQLTVGTATRTAPERWDRLPQIVAFGPYVAAPGDPSIALVALNSTTPPVFYQLCGGAKFGPFTLYGDERLAAAISCSRSAVH